MNTTAPQFSDAAVALWELQNEAVATRALATMGERVSLRQHVLRHEQADAAAAKFTEALGSADRTVAEEYMALLRWRHANGMR